MAIAQPQLLLVMDEASGTTITNYGSVGSNPTIAAGSSGTNWSWNKSTPPSSYLRLITPQQGANMPYVSMTGVTMPTTANQSIWCAMKFQVSAYGSTGSRGFLKGSAGGTGLNAAPTLRVVGPAGGGDFDLECRLENGSDLGTVNTFTALVFNTDYSIVMTRDATTPTAALPKFKLGAASVITGNADNLNGSNAYNGSPGYLGRGQEFSNYYGIAARIYYVAEGRGVALSDQDMADINTDPTVITGWPGASTGQPAGVRGRGIPGMRIGGASFGQGF